MSKTGTMSIFEKWMFFGHFSPISGSIFHPIFLKNEIKNEIKNGSKMRTVNTPNDSSWSFRDAGRREFNGDGRKHAINSGVSCISAIGFNFLKNLTIRTLLSIDVEVIMKYE